MKKWSFARILSVLLCSVIVVGALPLNLVHASIQKHVKIKAISSTVDKVHPAYSFSLEWLNPAWDTTTTPNVNTHPNAPTEFKIFEKNASQGASTFQVIPPATPITVTDQATKIDRQQLLPGSIYEYKVTPFHNHISSTDGTITSAPFDPSTPEESALFMTDLNIKTKGYGNTLEVTFSNPTYNGSSIFTAFRVYYQAGGSSVAQDAFKSSVDISIDNTDLVVSKDPDTGLDRLTYKIVSPNIIPGTIYAVKVEPLYGTNEIRDNDSAIVSINGETKHISYTPKRIKEYRTNDGHVAIPLFITEDGGQYLRLNWGDLSSLNTIETIKKIEIMSGESIGTINNIIGTAYSSNITSYRVLKPVSTTYYKIRVSFKPKSGTAVAPIESIIAIYDPSEVNITPSQPKTYPKPNVTENVSTIDFYWDTFIRPPYNDKEELLVDKNGMYFDTNVYYDIYVSDSIYALNKLGIPKIIDKKFAIDIPTTNIAETTNKVFYENISSYIKVDINGNFILEPIQENKTYYIRIVATKPTNDGLGLSSIPIDTQVYVPARGDISIPHSLSRPPLRIKKNDDGIDEIKQTNMTIEWNTKWFEIYDAITNRWHSSVSIRNGALIFDDNIKETDTPVNFYSLKTKEDVMTAFTDAGYTSSSTLIIREMDLSSNEIKYEMIVMPFDDINQSGGYEQYIENLLASDSELWNDISPKFPVENYAEYTITELLENTRYAILLRPYKMISETKKEAYPTYILATTLPTDIEIDITPTVPTIEEIGKTDISIEVQWNHPSESNLYELAISENFIEDPSTASVLIDSENITQNSINVTNENGALFKKYNITSLFPQTGYYIWVRSLIKDTDKKSDWSNPIYVRTNEIEKPSPPSGLGLASEKNLSTYNTNNNTEYKSVSNDYMVIEWSKDPEDNSIDVTSSEEATVEPLLDPNIKSTYMVKFNELLANKYYYVRAKTKATVIKTATGTQKIYSYIISFSPTSDFKDAIVVEIPTVEASGDKVLVIESDWTNVYKFKTSFAPDGEGDFDGNIIDDLYPLPTEDFEIIYDPTTESLVYKFRTNKVDANGNADNLVDQRFITNLINNKVYNYNIDLTHHNGYRISNRRVELPYTIISALDQRKISLSITTGGTRFTLNPKFLNTPEVKALGQMNRDTVVSISIAQTAPNLPILSYKQVYATSPQTLSISISNNGVYSTIPYTGSLMDIQLKLNQRGLTLENNISTYRNINNSKWENIPSIYNADTGISYIKTNRIGSYTTLATSINNTNINTNTNISNLLDIHEHITFTDLNNIDMSATISVVQFNNIVAGIANNKKEITINTALTTDDHNALKRSGMLLTGSVVRRDFGINSLIKLYELKTKSKYEPVDNINTTPFKDIAKSNKAYHQNLIKAGELGFFTNNANPHANLTLSDMLYMVDIIISDSGY